MVAEKIFITNRKSQKIAVLLERSENQKGLVFVMHGLSGFKEQPHIAAFAASFKEKGYTVVRFDTTNTLGESDGKYEDATATNYYEDLEDVIAWAQTQAWYDEPFCLVGHSLGGLCTALYAQKYPNKVRGLAPISTVVSGKLSLETYSKEEMEVWKRTGRRQELSKSTGRIKDLKWTHMEDRLRYDLLPNAHKLAMPVLLIVGDNDPNTPPKHQQLLFDKLPGKKELHIIKGAEHTFRDKSHLAEIKRIFLKWIETVSE